MKTCFVKFFAGSGIRLAVLSLLFLGLAGVCMAQASAAPARPAAQAATAPQAQPVAQRAQTRAPGAPAAKGNHEGIKVHGHWTIEIRNPDGTVVTHREFENALLPLQGDVLLAGLLTGFNTIGNWQVFLNTNAIPAGSFAFREPGPCGPSGTYACILGQPGSSAFTQPIAGITAATCTNDGNCFSTLSMSAIEGPGSNQFNEMQLTGTANAIVSGSIGSVTTWANLCYGQGATGAAGALNLSTTSPSTCFSALDSSSSIAFSNPQFTSATVSPAVAVSAGQTIAVTVVISFM